MTSGQTSSIQGQTGEINFPFKGSDLRLLLSPDVASPNHYTDLMLDYLACCEFPDMAVLDVGCGTGVLALSVSKYLGASIVHAVDISPVAVDLTVRNLNLNRCSTNSHAFVWDVSTDLPSYPYDVILANLPQIPTADIEPDQMCSGGPDGRKLIESVMRGSARRLISPNGVLLMVVADFVGISAIETLSIDLGLTVKIETQSIARPGNYTNKYIPHIESMGYRFGEDEVGKYFVLNLLSFRISK